MSKLQDFLLKDAPVGGDTAEVAIVPFPYPFVIRSITEAENKTLRKSCQKVTIEKKSRQKQTETDIDLYNNRLIVACCVEPNFKDAALQEKYGVMGAEDLLDKILKPGQFTDLLLAVHELNGFSDDVNELVEEAKN